MCFRFIRSSIPDDPYQESQITRSQGLFLKKDPEEQEEAHKELFRAPKERERAPKEKEG